MQQSILANVQQDVNENISFLLDEHGRMLSMNDPGKVLGQQFSTSIFGKYIWRIFSALISDEVRMISSLCKVTAMAS